MSEKTSLTGSSDDSGNENSLVCDLAPWIGDGSSKEEKKEEVEDENLGNFPVVRLSTFTASENDDEDGEGINCTIHSPFSRQESEEGHPKAFGDVFPTKRISRNGSLDNEGIECIDMTPFKNLIATTTTAGGTSTDRTKGAILSSGRRPLLLDSRVQPNAPPDKTKICSANTPCFIILSLLLIPAMGVILVRPRFLDPINFNFDNNNSTSPPIFHPTMPPTSSKFLAIKNIIEQATETYISTTDSSSPQLQAIQWLAYEDQWVLTDVQSVIQRYALAVLYFATGGSQAWQTTHNAAANRCNFLSPQKHECEWTDYSEDAFKAQNATCGVRCDIFRKHVTPLIIDHDTLNGTLPNEIGLIANLAFIQIHYNDHLVGSLPTTIGQLKQLHSLNIWATGLSGQLPSTLGNLQWLVSLTLIANKFNGTIPSEIGSIPNLQKLSLGFNQLTGTIPPSIVTNLTKLGELSLGDNLLSGTLPTFEHGHHGRLPRNLTLFDVGSNTMEGTIPDDIYSFETLVHLYFHDNFFTGTLSSNVAALTQLEHLILFGNQFVGTIPSSIGTQNTNLDRLILSNNNFTGTIPSTLGNLHQSLRFLYLVGNQLTGTIPSKLGSLQGLEQLLLGGNFLTGKLPASLGKLTNLLTLSVYKTNIRGTIPKSFTNLASLGSLLVYWTNLRGSMNFLSGLERLDLAVSDCYGDTPKINCSFCNACCDEFVCYVRGSNKPFFDD